MIRFGCLLSVVLVACNAAPTNERRVTPRSERTMVVAAASVVTPAVVPALPATASNGGTGPAAERPAVSSLRLKRLVVTTGVEDREPIAGAVALPSDGSAIYAFAELANPEGESENVRITFERKGGAERVGNVTLPVPGKVARHRTWAITHFIRVAGVWEAVLWSESGSELGRTSFEVAAS